MPRVKFAFSKDQLDAAPARTPTRTPTPTPTRGAIVNGVLALNPSSEIPDADRFTPMGHFGIVPVRTGIVRLAFMKLLITLLLAALCAGFSPNKHVAFSCSLAAAVNLIAVVHYAFIWAIRAGAPRGVQALRGQAARRVHAAVEGDGPEPWEADDKRNLLMREFAVDALVRARLKLPVPKSVLHAIACCCAGTPTGPSQYAAASNAASPSPVSRPRVCAQLVFMSTLHQNAVQFSYARMRPTPRAQPSTCGTSPRANPPFDAAADGNVTACVAAHGADGCVGRPDVPGLSASAPRTAARRAVRHGAALLPRRAAAADRPQR